MNGFSSGDELLEQFGGVESVRDRIIQSFLDSGSKNLAGIEDALQEGDLEVLRERVHAYRGSLGYFCQGEFYKMVVTMEELAKERKLKEFQQHYPEFLTSSSQLNEHLARVLG